MEKSRCLFPFCKPFYKKS